ncbi:TPA: DUF645 family protein, partial [Vibrio cholerae]|nr:DUF645 family protein [Vibrio cholerae]HBK7609935.1 DUF645 family protein [Vibrio cholerae]HBK7685101.1 DUF645 family protein [Vibrio cholerae]HDB1394063.1 DUF645 family protein [Vibrio cholerae]HEB4818226.1 DUF645 family protein [Vibrio cholerae]
ASQLLVLDVCLQDAFA